MKIQVALVSKADGQTTITPTENQLYALDTLLQLDQVFQEFFPDYFLSRSLLANLIYQTNVAINSSYITTVDRNIKNLKIIF